MAAKQGSTRLDEQLCFSLYRATNAITRAYRAPLAALGLTYLQYLVMMVLWEHGEQTVGGLAERLDLDSSTLTPLLKRLQRSGLLERERAAQNQRVVLVRATAPGQALRKAASQVQHHVACRTQLATDEFEGLCAQLHALSGTLAADARPRR